MKYAQVGLISLLLIVSCAQTNRSREQEPTVAELSAIVGQPIGRSPEVQLTGAAAATALGTIIAKEMDRFDRQQLHNVCEKQTTDQAVVWVNPQTGKTFQITPGVFSHAGEGPLACRQVGVALLAGGKSVRAVARACRNDQGQWLFDNQGAGARP